MKFLKPVLQFAGVVLLLTAAPAYSQSFRVQCPNGTTLHPAILSPKSTHTTVDSMSATDPNRPSAAEANPQIKCQEISGGDGYATMADGNQIYLFAFGPLSGLMNIEKGQPGTVPASEFNAAYPLPPAPTKAHPNPSKPAPLLPADLATPSTSNAAASEPSLIMNLGVLAGQAPGPTIAVDEDDELYLTLSNVGMIMRPDLFEQHTIHWHGYPNASSFFDGVPDASVAINIAGSFTYYYTAPDAGSYFWHCHITPPEHLQMGMEGQLWVRPRQNRLPTGASLYYALWSYENPAATVTPTIKAGTQTSYPKTSFPPNNCATDVLCTTPVPAADTAAAVQPATSTLHPAIQYAYNDGDGSTAYDVDVPMQLMGFDPNFHFIGMTFNPEPFVDMKDKYFLMSGRGYPDTVNPNPIVTEDSDGQSRVSQPIPTQIVLKQGQKALLRVSNLSVTEFHYLATAGIPMQVIAHAGRLLRDTDGNNLYYNSNSVEVGPGDNVDALLDSTNVAKGTYFLYSPALDHLSNDAENFGGMMTEIVVN